MICSRCRKCRGCVASSFIRVFAPRRSQLMAARTGPTRSSWRPPSSLIRNMGRACTDGSFSGTLPALVTPSGTCFISRGIRSVLSISLTTRNSFCL